MTSTIPRRKAILTIGVKADGHFDEEAIKHNIAEQTAIAQQAGLDPAVCLFDAKSTPEFVEGLIRQSLTAGPWEGVMVGFGLRRDPALTKLFELAINLCLQEIRPTPRFAFNSGPGDTAETLIRAFAG